MKIAKMVNWIFSVALGCGSASALAINYEMKLPEGDASHLHIQPGETANFTFDIRNLDSEAGTGIAWARIEDYQGSQGSQGAYVFGPSQQAACRQPSRSHPDIFAFQWSFPVDLGAGETIRCTYPVTRSATSVFTVRFFPCVGQDVSGSTTCSDPLRLLAIGTLTDIAFSISPIAELPVGATEAIVRITVRNLSDVDVDSFKLATSCVATPWNELPYAIDRNFPDACPLVQANPGCTYDGQFGVPPPIFNWLVGVSPTLARSETSCLVRMRFRQPLVAPVLDTLELRRPMQDRIPPIPLPQPANAQGRDVNASNDGRTPFGAIPFVATPVPSAGRIGLAALVVTFIALVGWRYRRRKLRE